jgi:hypothetical protein
VTITAKSPTAPSAARIDCARHNLQVRGINTPPNQTEMVDRHLWRYRPNNQFIRETVSSDISTVEPEGPVALRCTTADPKPARFRLFNPTPEPLLRCFDNSRSAENDRWVAVLPPSKVVGGTHLACSRERGAASNDARPILMPMAVVRVHVPIAAYPLMVGCAQTTRLRRAVAAGNRAGHNAPPEVGR